MARPTKRTPQVEEAILRALRAGSTRVAAAEYVGVDRTSLWDWMQRSSTFANAVMKAEAEAEVACVGVLRQAAVAGDWKAALAWLERRRPNDWKLTDRTQVDIRVLVRQMAVTEGFTDAEIETVVVEAERLLGVGTS